VVSIHRIVVNETQNKTAPRKIVKVKKRG